ncbi:MAG: dipeptide/oligopeptide/nickel ABC transporter ATP-binding protein [Acidimicrobiaceae bacterium]|nr:dipeptide/oligopeptide/nickel ABC transporter ATP-binding protein [Acidimicrobiaceae bacterium]|tara:strand:- start:704 stop:1771 length:1068 start_codon:yes stop_codon:yes gene_type:complete
MSVEPLLSVRDLGVTFRTDDGPVRAVDGVSFDLAEGRTLGIVGESGSGKSVTAKAIMNLLPSYAEVAGTITFAGRDVQALAAARERHFWGVELTMVFQDPMTSLNPVKRIGEQIAECLRVHLGRSHRAASAGALELLEQVGIPDPAKRLRQYPHELSGGLRQRVVIAMALACGPRLLIADEPTTALDVTVQKHILDLLDDLRRDRDMSMVLITHDLGVVRGRADEVMVLYGGRTMEQADTATLFDRMRHPYTEALLETIPRIDTPSHTRLVPIPGRPPTHTELRGTCPFAPRCRSCTDACLREAPPLIEHGQGHFSACFAPVGTTEGAAARADNQAAGTTPTGLSMVPFGSSKES